jgi:hypothetical protein
MLAFRQLRAQPGLFALGLAPAAVEVPRGLALPSGRQVDAATAALPDRHDSAPGRGPIVDLSLTVAHAERHL